MLDFAASQHWVLDRGSGAKTVYAQFRDRAGNWTDTETATITLEEDTPLRPGPDLGSWSTYSQYCATGTTILALSYTGAVAVSPDLGNGWLAPQTILPISDSSWDQVYMSCDPSGGVLVAGFNRDDNGNMRIDVNSSPDRGNSWKSPSTATFKFDYSAADYDYPSVAGVCSASPTNVVVFLRALQGSYDQVFAVATQDAGATWPSASTQLTHAGDSSYRYISAIQTVCRGARVVAALSASGVSLYRSTNGGASFAAVDSPLGQDWSNFRLVGDPNGGMLILTSTSGSTLVARRSTDGGATWSLPVAAAHPLLSGSFPNFYQLQAIAPAPGLFYAAWPEQTETDGASVLRVTVSKDGGSTWSAPTTVGPANYWYSFMLSEKPSISTFALAGNATGDVEMIWVDGRDGLGYLVQRFGVSADARATHEDATINGISDIYVATAPDFGKTWTTSGPLQPGSVNDWQYFYVHPLLLAPDGTAVARLEGSAEYFDVRFLHGTPGQPPAAPALVAPANAAAAVPFTPALTWNPSDGATSYDVYFGTVPSPPLVVATTGTSYNPGTLTAATTYYWRIVANNSVGTASSGIWSFTTKVAAPALLWPVNGEIDMSLAPALMWHSAIGATSYDVYFGTQASPPLVSNTTSVNYTPATLAAGTLYFWRVVAKNSSSANASPVWSFTTPLSQPATTALRFIPVTPCRIADTRGAEGPFGGPSLAADSQRAFAIPQTGCGIPASAQAYSLNVTVVPPGRLSYLTLWPAGRAQPTVSTLNSWDGIVVANAAIVPAGASGAVSVYVTEETDVILDINGYFDSPSVAASLAFYPATPCRVADTRGATGPFGGPFLGLQQTRDFAIPSAGCDIPSTASAYSMNATVVPKGYLGFLTAWPAGQSRPNVSTVNSWTGKVVANAALVPAGANESISVYASNPTDVVLDINGYFGAPGAAGALRFYAVTPCRVADTRGDPGPLGGPEMAGAEARSFPLPAGRCNIPHTAAAYSMNVTVVPDGALSFLTAWPTGAGQPFVSTLNSFDGAVVANAAIVPAGTNGAVSIYVTDRTHVILDINGYFAP